MLKVLTDQMERLNKLDAELAEISSHFARNQSEGVAAVETASINDLANEGIGAEAEAEVKRTCWQMRGGRD